MQEQARWIDIIREVGPSFAAKISEHDQSDTFVAENFAVLRERKVSSAMVPKELGGGGVTHGDMCELLRELAKYCSSTSLALSMHQHLVAAQRFNYQNGRPGQVMLEKVARGAMLVSTGATDWLASSGRAEKVDGGFKVYARKAFASGSPTADMLATTAPYLDPNEGWQVLHFAVPFSSEGMRVESDWQAMGMRATGSNTVVLDGVFVPEESVALRRKRGVYHPVWSIALGVAYPIIMAPYVGIAEAAAEIVQSHGQARKNDPLFQESLGEVLNAVTTARIGLDSMIALTNNFAFTPSVEHVAALMARKSIVTRAALEATSKAMETLGGRAYFRSVGLERLLRDAYAGLFHLLSEKKQRVFSGRLALGLDPAGEVRWSDDDVPKH
jgi:alkylation response protein AidB-like acyl-CoA dehydrogenase